MNAMFCLRFHLVHAALCLSIGLATAASDRALIPGKPAPSLSGIQWLVGPAVEVFSTGQVYVVEFIASTNSAETTALTNLVQYAREYAGSATLIGCWTGETNGPPSHLVEYLTANARDRQGRTRLSFAADSLDQPTRKAWLQASGTTNLPAAFVVSKDGKLAWKGPPGEDLDIVLGRVTSPLWHPGSSIQTTPELALRQKVGSLRKAGRPKEALQAIETATQGDPLLGRSFAALRLSLMFQLDEAAARSECRKLAEGIYRNDPPILAQLAGVLQARPSASDKAAALPLAESACQQTDYRDAAMVSCLAKTHAANGNPAKSAELIETLLKTVEANGGDTNPQLRGLRLELDRYRKSAKLPGVSAPPNPTPREKTLTVPN